MSTRSWARRDVLKIVSAAALAGAHARPAAAQAIKWLAGSEVQAESPGQPPPTAITTSITRSTLSYFVRTPMISWRA
jgi:hypothetical protein